MDLRGIHCSNYTHQKHKMVERERMLNSNIFRSGANQLQIIFRYHLRPKNSVGCCDSVSSTGNSHDSQTWRIYQIHVITVRHQGQPSQKQLAQAFHTLPLIHIWRCRRIERKRNRWTATRIQKNKKERSQWPIDVIWSWRTRGKTPHQMLTPQQMLTPRQMLTKLQKTDTLATHAQQVLK